jgi:hypothetical protein
VFLMQLSTQFVNTNQIACPTNLVSQRRIILQPNFLKIKNKKAKKINSIKEPSKFFSLSLSRYFINTSFLPFSQQAPSFSSCSWRPVQELVPAVSSCPCLSFST